MTSPVFQIDAFSEGPFSGNPAAVVLLEGADWPEDALLLNIAASNNLSETAFFHPSRPVPTLRWFTPTVEVDLCGHATLASGWVVLHVLRPEASSVTFESQSGPLEVRRGTGEALLMDLPARPPREQAPPEGMADALGVPIDAWLVASKAMAVARHEDDVRRAAVDLQWVKNLPTDGLILTAPGEEVDFVSRYFAPHAGIDEDPVTGSAHCTLGPYWSKRLQKGSEAMIARQLSRRGGRLGCRWVGERVELEGNARLFLRGSLTP